MTASRHRSTRTQAALLAALFAAAACASAPAQTTYTFDNLPVGTAVTTQYNGVTFSAAPQSCGGSPAVSMRIAVPNGGTSSGTRALAIDTGCPDFSPDYLRMVFDLPQDRISFTLGDYGTTYIVRAYSTTSGTTGLISTQSIVATPAGQFVGVFRPVVVASASANIRRIEVESGVGLYETIDDLTFQPDPTPPIADITAPTSFACVCSTVTIRGTANDPDGTYLRDRAEYRPAAGGAWVLIDDATVPVTDGLLYNWNTGAIAEGDYLVRLTVEGSTGLSSTDEVMVHVSRSFDTVEYSVPAVAGGTVCPDGTVFDAWCGTESYAVEYAPSGGGAYQPVEPGTASYTGDRVNQTLAHWNTQSPLVPDGSYTVRVRAENACGDARSLSRTVVVDNTAPTVAIASPVRCVALGTATLVPVTGTVQDAHLGGWTLEYTGGDTTGWTTIASGVGPVSNGALGIWNTTGLRRCAYTLRLVATDTSQRNCCGDARNRGEFTLSVDLGCEADFNRTGGVTVQDIYDYLEAWYNGCP